MTQLQQDVPPPFERHKPLGTGGTPHPDPDGDHNKPTDLLLLLVTFMGWLGVRRERDVVELTEAEPLAIDRNTKVAEIDGLPGGLGDLVCGGSRGLALRRQIRHDDSAFAKTNPRERDGERGVAAFVLGATTKNSSSERRRAARGGRTHQYRREEQDERDEDGPAGASPPPLHTAAVAPPPPPPLLPFVK